MIETQYLERCTKIHQTLYANMIWMNKRAQGMWFNNTTAPIHYTVSLE